MIAYRQRFRQRNGRTRTVSLAVQMISHIQHDDQDYVDAVRDNMILFARPRTEKGKKLVCTF